MKTNKLYSLIIGTLIMASSFSVQADKDYAEAFFSDNPSLTKEEKEALAIAKSWQAGSPSAISPVKGSSGSVSFVFGAQQPSIICAVLQVCDVSLQAGERVNSIHLGDTGRWLVDPAITGSGPNEIQHLIIKPLDTGLDTSLIVTTNRRTYHIKMRSHKTKYMPQVSFTYPEDIALKWSNIQARERHERVEKTIPQTGEYLGDLSFDYEITGSPRWRPVRVYNNGTKTIIQMPETMSQSEAPTLLMVRKDGGFFSDEETTLINYRVQNNRYIVDSVFDKAILIAGVGSDQDRVTITRSK